MNDYLLPVDDGLPARESGEWVKEKLFFVKRYIDTFEIAMRGRSWRRRTFIDLFSGPGKCVIRDTNEFIIGSPLLAIQTQFPFTDYYFNDLDQSTINSLAQRVSSSGISKEHIHYFVGDANRKVKDIFTEIDECDREFIKGDN